jgi:simple sugar transport system permease protein
MLDVILLAIVASTPLLFAVQGELVVQRSGMINLGVEAMLLAAAFGAALAGVAGGIGGAALIALVFGVFAITLRADQIVTGTAVNLLTIGLTGFASRELAPPPPSPFGTDWLTPLAWIAAPALVAILLWNTTFGLRLRAAGENPEALPVPAARYRWGALGVQALLTGLGGTHLALVLSTGFAENMSAGRGFIALAVVIFARWTIRGALAGTALFGLAVALQYALQASNKNIPYHLLLATPYVVTLLILCGVTGRIRAPEALGK